MPTAHRDGAAGNWAVYLIRTRFGTLYTGTATHVSRRLEEHRQGGSRGSRFLRSKGPLTLVYTVALGNRALACAVESRIKRLTRRKKEEIVSAAFSARALLAFLHMPS